MNARSVLPLLALAALCAPLCACSALARPDPIEIQAEPAGPPKTAPQPAPMPAPQGANAPGGGAQPSGG